jgi:hypothetical protein
VNVEDLILISVDDHVVEPPGMFDNHMTQAELDTIAPRLIEENGTNFWLYEGHKIGNMGLNAVVGRPKEEYGMEPLRYEDMREGVYSIDARIGDMDANGILSSICFPTFPTFAGNLFHQSKDKQAANRVIEARWLKRWKRSLAYQPQQPLRSQRQQRVAMQVAQQQLSRLNSTSSSLQQVTRKLT